MAKAAEKSQYDIVRNLGGGIQVPYDSGQTGLIEVTGFCHEFYKLIDGFRKKSPLVRERSKSGDGGFDTR